MNTLANHLNRLVGSVRQSSTRLVLGAALAAAGFASTAQAHHSDLRLDIRFNDGHAELGRRQWVDACYQDRQVRTWVEPVYQVTPEQRVWVAPVYRTVCDHVWREPVVQNQQEQVWVELTYQDRDVMRGPYVQRERIVTPAHYETHIRQVVVSPGHYEDVARQELVAEGHWQLTESQQVLVSPGHWDTRFERVCVTPAHWEERTMVRVYP